jgi:hypothetical protein
MVKRTSIYFINQWLSEILKKYIKQVFIDNYSIFLFK